MKRRTAVVALLAAVSTLQGCIASTVVLHVAPDGHGRAVITARVYEPALHAFDSMFSESPKHAKGDEQLPPPGPGEMTKQFGAQVRLASSKLDRTSDGVIRTTVVEFDDVRALRIPFPPLLAMPSGMHYTIGIGGLTDQPLITFDIKPHENGDRLLLVKLPDGRVAPDMTVEPEMTVFKTDSPEERLFKRAIQQMSVKFFVELEDVPLLRTNAPATKGNRATILDLDLEKLITNLDETKLRRAMMPGSMQEVLWQLGDMPGAVVPREHEVFLEFEPPHAAQLPPATPPPAAQTPPDTEIYLAPLKIADGTIEVGAVTNITNNPGYDNQPFFTPDGRAVLFTSVRGGTQTDIYRYELPVKHSDGLAAGRVVQVTNTPESEYSPTITPAGALSVIRVELDGNNTQRLWQFTADGREPRVVLENVKPVGYHAWADDHTLALFVLGQPATLQLADTRTGTARTVASEIGRSIHRIPGSGAVRDISFVQRERVVGVSTKWLVKKLNPATGEVTALAPALDGGTDADVAWTPDGTLVTARNGVLLGWKPGQSGWKAITSLERLSLAGVTRLAVSPKGDFIALVGSPRQPR